MNGADTIAPGVPAPGAFTATVAVRATASPTTLAEVELASDVEVDAFVTVSASAADVLVAKLPSPL